MELNFNWINLLILFGAVQGLLFAIILFFNRKHPGARFLGILIFVFSYNGFETFNWSSGLDQYNFLFELFTYIVIFAAGPGLYLYVISLLYPERRLYRKNILLHFGLALTQLGIRIGLILYHLLWMAGVFDTEFTFGDMGDWYWNYAEPLSVVVFIGYVTASIIEFRKSKASGQIKSIPKDMQPVVYRWVKALLICMIVLAIAWPLTLLVPFFIELPIDEHYYPVELLLVLFIYWIAMRGYYHTKLIYLKPARTVIPDEGMEKHIGQLQHAMHTDKLYLDPELNLTKVSTHTGIPSKTISFLLNQYRQVTFNDFVNDYRVREVTERLTHPDHRHLTISGIALESGFNSQATFQRVFKNKMGMSPRDYVNSQLKKEP